MHATTLVDYPAGVSAGTRTLTTLLACTRPAPEEAAADRLFLDTRSSPTGDSLREEVTPGQRRADALALLAESALSADLDRGTAGERYQVVLHVDDPTAAASTAVVPDAGGALELDHGAQRVSAETSRRLSCDAAVVTMRHDNAGLDTSVSRRTRTIPAAIRRALAARDRTCRFPGCTSRRSDAHHIEHWADGGATRLDNLVLLCRRHHRAVHEDGFDVAAGEAGGSSSGSRMARGCVRHRLPATSPSKSR